jgi:hypothetical protein
MNIKKYEVLLIITLIGISKTKKNKKMASNDDFVENPVVGTEKKTTPKNKNNSAWKRQINNRIMDTLRSTPDEGAAQAAPEEGAARAAADSSFIVSSTLSYGEKKKTNYVPLSFEAECSFATHVDENGVCNAQYFDHVDKINKMLIKKNNNEVWTKQEEIKFNLYEKNFKLLKRFLSFEHFKFNKMDRYDFPYLHNHYFSNQRYEWDINDGITMDLISHLMTSKNHSRYNLIYVYFNFLITFFMIHQKKLFKEPVIREKIADFFFMIAVLSFSLELKAPILPSSSDIMIISKTLATLSNGNLFYTIENVNRALEESNETMRFTLTRKLQFYSNKCPGRNTKTKKEEKTEETEEANE